MEKFAIGTRVYNRGDQCNQPHWGTITDIRHTRFGTQYKITTDAEPAAFPGVDNDTPSRSYWVEPCSIHEVDLGHGGTRIVTNKA